MAAYREAWQWNPAHDVKAVADAQGRLERVVEELSQRLAEHDRQLADHSVNQVFLRDALHKVQLEEVARHDSFAAERLRLRTGAGDTASRLTLLESKVVGLDKVYTTFNCRLAELEQATNGLPATLHDVKVTHHKQLQGMYHKVVGKLEEQRAEFFQFQGQVSRFDGLVSLQKQFEKHRQEVDSRLQAVEPNAMLAQLQQHVETSLRQQLSTHRQELQSKLQRQLEHLKAHYSGQIQDLRDMCEAEARRGKELSDQLRQRLLGQDGVIAEGQQALRQEAAKRERHLAELQDAAQRSAQTAMERAQASREARTSSLTNRLAVVEDELQSTQHQEKERQQKSARVEEDLTLSPREEAGPSVSWLSVARVSV